MGTADAFCVGTNESQIHDTQGAASLNTATAERLELLRRWDTPALSNALDSLRIRPHNTGYTNGSISRIAGGTFAGIAVTARMVARDAGEDGLPVAELHAAIAGSELVVLSEAAHLSNMEQPEEFSKAVLAFLVHS